MTDCSEAPVDKSMKIYNVIITKKNHKPYIYCLVSVSWVTHATKILAFLRIVFYWFAEWLHNLMTAWTSWWMFTRKCPFSVLSLHTVYLRPRDCKWPQNPVCFSLSNFRSNCLLTLLALWQLVVGHRRTHHVLLSALTRCIMSGSQWLLWLGTEKM